jgi:hypothetical protein
MTSLLQRHCYKFPSTYKKTVEFPTRIGTDYWGLNRKGDSANVSVGQGTILMLNSMVIEITQSCRIQFPLDQMGRTEILFSKNPDSISFDYNEYYNSYRNTSGSVNIPGGKTIQLRNGYPASDENETLIGRRR